MDKEIRKYIAAVGRRLNLPGKIKQRCLRDLQTTITARTERGESWEDIRASLGKPAQAAADLNGQMKDFAYRKSPWRFAFLAAAVISGGWLAFYAGMQMVLGFIAGEAASIGVIGGADGPTAIFVTTSHNPDWDVIILAAVLAAGIAGFIRPSRCKKK